MQEKIIPQNISAEQNVLCAMLIDNKAVGTVSGILKPDDFYRQAHQVIYRAMLNLYGRSEPVDLVTVIEELRKMNKLQEVGDVSYITLLGEVAPTAANVKFHAQIVADKAMQRQLIESGTVIASLGYECPDGEIRNAVDSAQKQLLELTGRRRGRDFVPIQEIVESTVDRMGSMVESDEPVTGLRTGFTDLDEVTAGLQPSDFIILAARPSMGKTALALNIAQNVALRGAGKDEAPKRVAFFSLEMSRDQLVQRMICTEADLETGELRPRREDSTLKYLKQADAAESQTLRAAAEGIEIADELFGRLIALLEIDAHGLHGERVQLFRDLRNNRARVRREAGDVLKRDLLGRFAVIGQRAGEHLIEHNAERIEVAAGVRLKTLGLLGRDIVHGADGRVGSAAAVFVLKGGDAEISHLGDAVAVDHNVLRLNIAMHDAVLMRVLERLCDLRGKEERLRRGELPLAGDILLERDAFDQLHDDILHRERMAHIVHRDDVRMAEHGDGMRLGLELRLELRVGEDLFAQHLDGDVAVEPVVERFIDNGHAAGADDLEKLVAVIQQLADIFVLRLVHTFPPDGVRRLRSRL